MDLSSLGILLTIVAASGAIAFWADKLGKKMGKKRLSLFGLRPKHVAALTTVLMGVGVSLFTIGLIALSSRDARRWLREGHQLLVERDRYAKQVTSFRDEAASLHAQNLLARKQLVELQGRYDDLTKRTQGLDARIASLNGELKARTDELQKNNRLLTQAQAGLQRSRGDLAESRRNLIRQRRELTVLKDRASAAQAQVLSAQGDLKKAKSDLATANTNKRFAVEQANSIGKKSVEALAKVKDLTAQVKALESEAATRTEEVAGLQRQIKDYADLRDDAERRANAARDQLVALQGQLDQARADAASLGSFIGSAVKTSRQEPLTYAASEEVARVVVPAGATSEDAENAVTSLLRQARVNAEARGARGHQSKGGQTFAVADVFDRQDPKTGDPVSGEDLKRVVVQRAVGHDEEQVLVATASLNAFRGEPVSLDVAVVPNPMVYRRHQLVAESRIDGSLTEDRILAQFSEFVASDVRERAEQAHMIPRANTAAPFGEVPLPDVLNLLRDVKRAGHSVRVQAVAGADTHAADPLRLEFRIK